MKIAPLIAIIFAFFLIAIYPIYSDDGIDENLSYSDEDNDGIPSDKDNNSLNSKNNFFLNTKNTKKLK